MCYSPSQQVSYLFSAGIISLLSRYYISSKNASHTSLGQQAKMNPYWPVLCPRSLYGFACGAVSDYLINSGRISRLDMQKVSNQFACSILISFLQIIVNLAFLFPAAGMIGLSFLLTPELQVRSKDGELSSS